MPRDRREDGLANPPHGVADELHAVIGVELPRGGEQPEVAFADQVQQRKPAVLVFLRDGNDEAEILGDQLLHRRLVTLLHPPGDRDFLGGREQRGLADLVQIEIQNVAFRVMHAERSGRFAVPVPRLLHRG